MLKHRVVPLVLLTGYNVVKSIQFSTYRTLGNPITVCRIYESRGVDELVLLDIRATQENRGPNLEIIRDVCSECFMPVTVGGGIADVEHARQILRCGADKVAINSHAVDRPSLITEIAREFGKQCCVVSMDVRRHPDGGYEVFTHGGKTATGLSVVDWAQRAEALGAGELLVNAIDRDGLQKGFDLELMRLVTNHVTIPVVAAGGAGKPEDFSELFRNAPISAVAAASIYHFTSHTPLDVKRELALAGVSVRW